MPIRMARDAGGIEVGGMMTCCARQARRAVSVGTAHHERLVRPHLIGLRRTITGGMTIHAAGMAQHFAHLSEQRDRARALVCNPSKVRDRTKFSRWARSALGPRG